MQSIIYLHGFNSSSQSHKAHVLSRYLRQHRPDILYYAPDLPFSPCDAMQHIDTLVNDCQQRMATPLLVGSSLGGFYAMYAAEKHGLKAALINPAMVAHELLIEHLGEQTNYHTQEKCILTLAHIEQLKAFHITDIKAVENFLIFLQTADEVLDYRRAVALFSRSKLWVQAGGSHAFDDFENTIPAILNFMNKGKTVK